MLLPQNNGSDTNTDPPPLRSSSFALWQHRGRGGGSLGGAAIKEEMGGRTWQCLREAWGVDLRAAAVARFGVGVLLCLDIAVRAGDLAAFYTEGSAVEAGKVTVFHMGGSLAASLYFAAGSLLLVRLLMAVSLVFAASLAVGYHTGASTFVSWLLLLSLQNRNLLVLNAGDDLLRLLLFWGMFIPWGRKWSVDAYFKGRMRLDGGRKAKEVDDCWWLGVGGVAARLQLSWMYLESYLVKVGPQWVSGDAVWYALNDEEFTTRIGHLVLAFSPAWFLRWMSHVTLFLELSLPILFLCPVIPFFPLLSRSLSGRLGKKRWSGAAVASACAVATVVAVHIGFGSCLEIGFFPYIPVVFAALFIPAVVMDLIEAQLWPERPPEDSLLLSATPEQACLLKPFVSLLGLEEAVRFTVGQRATLSLSSQSCGEDVQLYRFWSVTGLLMASPLWKRLWKSHSLSVAEFSSQRHFFAGRVASATLLAVPAFLAALLTAVLFPVLLRLFMGLSVLCLLAILVSARFHCGTAEAVGSVMTSFLSLTSFRRLPPYSGRRNKKKRQVLCLIALVYVGFWVSIPYTHYQSPAWPYIKWVGSLFRLEQVTPFAITERIEQ